MAHHYELTAEQFATIEDLMPATGKPGGQWSDHLRTLNGILWVLHTGARRRELPERHGNCESVHDRLSPPASGRHLRPHPGAAAHAARRAGQDRSRPLVRRCHQHPGQPCGGRGRGGKRSPTSRRTTPSAAPAAASAPSSAWSSTATACPSRRWRPPARPTSRSRLRSDHDVGTRPCGDSQPQTLPVVRSLHIYLSSSPDLSTALNAEPRRDMPDHNLGIPGGN